MSMKDNKNIPKRSTIRRLEKIKSLNPILSKELISELYISEDEILSCFDIWKKNGQCSRIINKFFVDMTNNFDIWKRSFERLLVFNIKNPDIKSKIYIPEYIIGARNLRTLEEAERHIKEFKSSKATSREGFIKRHGPEVGEEMFNRFQETSASMKRESIIKRLGTDDEEMIKSYLREISPLSPDHYMKRGFTKEESIAIAREHNIDISGANRTYWERRGYKREEIDEILLDINKKKVYTYKNYINDYGREWIDVVMKKIDDMNDKNGAYVPDTEYERYEMRSRLITEIYFRAYEDIITNANLRGYHDNGSCYHLDHIFSVKEGFKQGIPPEIMGHVVNLRVVPSRENIIKGSDCLYTKEELIEEYNKHESKAYN